MKHCADEIGENILISSSFYVLLHVRKSLDLFFSNYGVSSYSLSIELPVQIISEE